MRTRRLSIFACGLLAAFPAGALADVDPAGCTQGLEYDSSIPTFKEVVGTDIGGGAPGPVHWHQTADLYKYQAAVVAATQDNPRVKVIEKDLGPTTLGTQRLKYSVIGTPENIDNLDAGRNDAAFWSGVISGRVSETEGLAAVRSRPAFAWVTATPHGSEPAAGEASMRLLYELAARKDCANARRLRNLTLFIDPARNPDGRDLAQRTTAWGFDPNRDFGVRNQLENAIFLPEITKYPGLFFIDAHQQTQGYFFPPNEDPVHHEISHFALDLIQEKIGPALQQKFNDQTSSYQNYFSYDLFVPEYGDTVPSLVMGGAGMTYEKGITESYGKQVYDHYLAMDVTVNVTANDKANLLRGWIKQWQEAIDQGADCGLQENVLVSPLHDEITQQPTGTVCGYFYKPGLHTGDVAKLMQDLQSTGVNVYSLDEPVTLDGVHEFGPPGTTTETLPAGTLYIPMAQPMKHWIQAVLGEDPFLAFEYFYDVSTWSYSLNRGMAGNGVLTKQMPSGVGMTQIGTPNFGAVEGLEKAVYAFATDSMAGLGLVIDLLREGATVYRSETGFDVAGGRHFPTGTALVDTTATRSKVAQLTTDRQTPVYGIDGYPTVDRYAITRPKVALYTAGPEPPNPSPAGTAPKGHCGAAATADTSYCMALFTLKVKDALPAADIRAVTDAELPTLTAQGFTALVNPGQTIANVAALQAFVNLGGTYVGTQAGGTTSARNAGMTNANTASISGLTTGGSTFDGSFNTSSPAAWGFDEGGFIYREKNAAPVYDPASLAGRPPVIPDATAAVSYASPLTSFGFHRNAVGEGKLDGRPAVIDQPLGMGRVVLIGFDPFYRAWHESSERLALNAILYPKGQPVASGGSTRSAQDALPIPARLLPAAGSRPLAPVTTDRDVRITVARHNAAALRRAVVAARLRRSLMERVGYENLGRTVTLVIRGVRGDEFHDRAFWVGKLMYRIKAARIRTLVAQV